MAMINDPRAKIQSFQSAYIMFSSCEWDEQIPAQSTVKGVDAKDFCQKSLFGKASLLLDPGGHQERLHGSNGCSGEKPLAHHTLFMVAIHDEKHP